MVAIEIDGKIKTFSSIPKTWNNTSPYHLQGAEIHKADGFYPVVYPAYNSATHKLGELIENGETYTYSVVEKTPEELQAELISNSQNQRANIIQEIQEKKVVEELQAETSEEKLLEVAAIFPIWEPDLEVTANQKYQHFKDGELVLFRVIQSHTTQADWKPENTPSLFVRVGYEGEILDWKQPTGAHDAYSIGDKVKFEGDTWESLINGNTWSPTAYPQGWSKL